MISGAAAVGNLNHAKIYGNFSMSVTNAISRALWPVNLHEANEDGGQFFNTGQIWPLVQVVFLLTGVFMALLGGEIIGWLTNGKFYEAWPVSVAFIAAFLIQTAGKPQTASRHATACQQASHCQQAVN